jgi:hypothetical protein
MRGDLLALKVALAACVIGYAEIATRLASRPYAHAATNPYRVPWTDPKGRSIMADARGRGGKPLYSGDAAGPWSNPGR